MSIKANNTEKIAVCSPSFVVVGCVRNCQYTLEDDFIRIRTALAWASKVCWFLVESDSSDATIRVLSELKEKYDNFYYKSCGNLVSTYPRRTERLAFCRNEYVAELRSNRFSLEMNYVIVADFHGINAKISADSVLSSWDAIDWDVCAANQDA